MAERLHHGSPKKGLKELKPGQPKDGYVDPNHVHDVFASTERAVAAMFTLQRTVDFLIDPVNKRVYLDEEQTFIENDKGGSLYVVEGEFVPASDELIFEKRSWQKVDVVEEEEIESAASQLRRMGYDIYADPDLTQKVEKHLGAKREFPKRLPKNVKPLNL